MIYGIYLSITSLNNGSGWHCSIYKMLFKNDLNVRREFPIINLIYADILFQWIGFIVVEKQ